MLANEPISLFIFKAMDESSGIVKSMLRGNPYESIPEKTTIGLRICTSPQKVMRNPREKFWVAYWESTLRPSVVSNWGSSVAK